MMINVKYRNTTIATAHNLSVEALASRLAQEMSTSVSELKAKGFWLDINGTRASITDVDATPVKNLPQSCTEPDGSVWGVRFFNVFPPGFLVSPTTAFVWEHEDAIAEDFTNAGAVRGHFGFHAAWVADFNDWIKSPIDHGDCPACALVRGYGDIISGEEGWRSSRLRIVKVSTKHKLLPKLRERYKTVEFTDVERGKGIFLNHDLSPSEIIGYRFGKMSRVIGIVNKIEFNDILKEFA